MMRPTLKLLQHGYWRHPELILNWGNNMKLTNRHNLPDTFVNVLKKPTYSSGGADLSVTQLINSPQIVALKRKHAQELEEDVSDMVWSLFGTAVHSILENGKQAGHTVEQRIHTNIDGWNLSGAIDLQIDNGDGTISVRDYKVTGAWSVMAQKEEWENQLNVYAFLIAHVKQKPVKDIAIVAIVRDWSRRQAKTQEDYPASPIVTIPIPLWTYERQLQYVKDRIAQHSECDFQASTGAALPKCTPSEMWEKPTIYAVKKVGAVRAKSLHVNEQEAIAAKEKLGNLAIIEVRPGERTRCAEFCAVNKYCQQWQEYQSTKE